MFFSTYYAQNYAGIIGAGLAIIYPTHIINGDTISTA